MIIGQAGRSTWKGERSHTGGPINRQEPGKLKRSAPPDVVVIVQGIRTVARSSKTACKLAWPLRNRWLSWQFLRSES